MSINPRVDIAFKKIFGVEENKDILIALLNAIVSQEDQLDDLEVLNPYNERNFKGDKLSILDIKARNKHTKTYFLIEMQIAEEMAYHKRSLYTWARMYANQLKAGNPYDELRKTIAVHILNFTFIHYEAEKGWTVFAPNKYHHRFVLTDAETQLHIHKDIEIHTLELSKFEGSKAKDLDNLLPAVKNMLDAWIAVLTHHELLNSKDLPKVMDTPEIRKALDVMETVNFTPIERDMYDAHLDYLRMEQGALETRFEKGRKQGREEGREEGREAVARNSLARGLDLALVAEITGLDLEMIRQIKETLP